MQQIDQQQNIVYHLKNTLLRHKLLTLLLVSILILLFVHRAFVSFGTFPESWNLGVRAQMDDFKQWVIVSRTSDPVHPIFSLLFNPLSDFIEMMLDNIENFLIGTSWLVIVAGIFLLTQRIASLRMAIFVSICVLAMGWLGLWEESMETLALMLFSVLVSLLIGIPLGILAAKNDRVDQILRPILDAMQTMPAFVYLIPVLLFFGIGGVPAMVATVIYAIPPAIRLTNLGIRSLSDEALEAAHAFGSTPRQTLFKVEIPMALPSIMTGVNQTIMMALGIVVIASLIGFAGLGDVVLKALRRLRVGQAFEAGLAIVFLAILLDRISYALSQIEHSSIQRYRAKRLFPEKSWFTRLFGTRSQQEMWIADIIILAIYTLVWIFRDKFWMNLPFIVQGILLVPLIVFGLHIIAKPAEYLLEGIYRLCGLLQDGLAAFLSIIPLPQWQQFVRQQSYWITTVLLLLLLNFFCLQIVAIPLPAGSDVTEDDMPVFTLTEFPEVMQFRIRNPIDDAVDWMQINLYDINDSGIGTKPLSDFLTLRFISPLRVLMTETLPWIVMILLFSSLAYMVANWRLALFTCLALLLIGGLGMWEHAMDTLSQVLVAVGISVLTGIPLGIWSARNDLVESILRAVLDFLQTIPPFVYLLPVIMLFTIGRVPGIIASVLYALPPVVRLTNLGIRQVDAAAVEAAQAFGSTPWQALRKVQLPLALPAIMLGINQTIMMVLAMVIIAGLVGGGGLGFEVVAGLAQNELGRGVEAGLAIVLLAIVLDRMTQAFASQQAKRMHIRV